MKIILSTGNPSKALQIGAVFAGSNIEVLTLADVGILEGSPEEGDTVEANSRQKALFAWEKTGKKHWTMADDTGLFIDALDGAPGKDAALWAGEVTPGEKTMHFTLEKLLSVPHDLRSATFMTVATLVSPDGEAIIFTGEVRGKLLDTPRAECQPKMPYSPIFVPDGHEKTWAEMTTEEENAVSHRGKAFSQVREYLLGIL
jgi:XTP/dITP diphosphohydrolase